MSFLFALSASQPRPRAPTPSGTVTEAITRAVAAHGGVCVYGIRRQWCWLRIREPSPAGSVFKHPLK